MTINENKLNIGVLSLHISRETKAIINAIEALGHEATWIKRENVEIIIEDGNAIIKPDVDIVVNRMLLTKMEQPAGGFGLAKIFSSSVPMLNPPESCITAIHKFATAMLLVDGGVPVPDALLALDYDRLNEGKKRFGDTAVYKTAIGTNGGGTWRVEKDNRISPRVGQREAFLQEFIKYGSGRNSDLRVYVVGGEIIGAMKRYARKGDWRTNVVLGGDIENAEDILTKEIRDNSLKSAEVLGLDYAGVDLVESEDGWKVLEVNPTAGFRGLFKATGICAAPYIAELAISRMGGVVERSLVEKLALSFDDSEPLSIQNKHRRHDDENINIMDFITEVVVRGTRGYQSVEAKADTGASRTSIDMKLAAKIGAGPILDTAKVRTGNDKEGRSRPLVDIVIGVKGRQHTVTASVEDRSHMEYQMILGRDILQHYQIRIK
jgi:RimK family alpha-L-glutamate ligase